MRDLPAPRRAAPIFLLAILIARASAQDAGALDLNCSSIFDIPAGPFNATLVAGPEQISRASDDLQLLVDCVPPDGSLLLNVSKFQPLRRVVIDKPLALGVHNASSAGGGTPNGEVVLECPEGDGVLLLRSHGIRITGITFANCRTTSGVAPIQLQNCAQANTTQTDQAVRFLRTTFRSNTNQNGTGGALTVSNCTAIVEDTLFVDNSGVDSAAVDVAEAGTVSFLECVFLNNTAGSSGGALGAKGRMLTIMGCRFEGNQAAANGGAIFSQASGEASISITNSVFQTNLVHTRDKIGGGAIFLEGRGVSCSISDNVIFEDNRAALAGGAVAIVNGTNLSIGAASFAQNSASRGGALYIESESDVVVSIKDAAFTNNSAESADHHGGAIELWRRGAAVHLIRNVTFKGNNAQGTGGGVSMGSGAVLNITGALFANNTAHDGGAISLQAHPQALKSTMLVANTMFEGNMASGHGGALAVFGVARLSAAGAEFMSNSAGEGGALYIKGTDQTVLEVQNATFNQNAAEAGNDTLSGTGGAVSISGPFLNGTIRSSSFLLNVANVSGGGIKASDTAALQLTECNFSRNTAGEVGGAMAINGTSQGLTISTTSFVDNDAAEAGGAVHLNGDLVGIDLHSIRFARNAARGPSSRGGAICSESAELRLAVVGQTIFEENMAAFGGGCSVQFANGGDLSMADTQFRRNQATVNGGGLSMVSTVSLPMSLAGVTFSRNEAGWRGGGMALSGLKGVNVSMLHAAFHNNSASGAHGGGLCVESSPSLGLDLVDVEFVDNKAESDGGAAYMESLATSVPNSGIDAQMGQRVRFSGNWAVRGRGGAVYVAGGGIFRLRGEEVQFDDNGAEHGGGMYCNPSTSNTSIAFTSTRFLQNHAHTSGGAIDIMHGCSLALNASIFRANRALTTDGGAIHVAGCSNVSITKTNFTQNSARLEGGAVFIEYFDSDPYQVAMLWILGSKLFSNSAGSVLSLGGEVVPTSGRGGACLLRGSSVSGWIADSEFEGNKAGEGGGLHWAEGSVQITNSTFVKNTAMLGGACFLELKAQGGQAKNPTNAVLMEFPTYLRNEAMLGGAIFAHSSGTCIKALSTPPSQAIHILHGNFSRNIGSEAGAAVYAGGVRIHCEGCFFSSNQVPGDVRGGCGGAVRLVDQAIANVTASVFGDNLAPNGGALCIDNSVFNGTRIDLERNWAVHNGGAMEVLGSRTKLIPGDVLMGCRDCHIVENRATDGGGIHFLVQNSSSAEACSQLQDSPSTFDAVNWLLICGTDEDPALDLKILVENSTVLNNTATRSGGALFTNVPDAVQVCCNCSIHGGQDQQPPSLFLGSSLAQGLAGACTPQWVPNMVLREDTAATMFGTSISEITLRPSTVQEHRSGTPLEPIEIVLQDAFGQIVRDSRTLVSVSAPAESHSIRLLGQIVSMAQNGVAIFDGLIVWALPGTYTLTLHFTPDDPLSTIDPVRFTVGIRKCSIGEVEAEDGYACKVCSFGFHGLVPGSQDCTPCHPNALCNGTTITPKMGFWHSSSKSTEVHACVVEEACMASRSNLQDAVDNSSDEAALFGPGYPQCTLGFDGVLCGSCEEGYGHIRVHQCKECTSKAGTAAGFGVAVLVTVLIVILFIKRTACTSTLSVERMHLNSRGGRDPLPQSACRRASQRQRRPSFLGLSGFPVPSWSGFSGRDNGIEMTDMDGEADTGESNLAVLVDGASTSDGQNIWNEGAEEEHRRSVRVLEILKILINFMQATSAAALLRFNWPSVMIKILDVQDVLSGFSNGSGLFSIDCLFPASFAVPKSILTISIGTVMPLVLVVTSSLFWALKACVKRSGWRHLLQRIVMSSLVIVYLAWWDTWNRLFRVFHCAKVDKEGGPFALAGSRYWLEDTDVECFEGGHLHMVVGLAFPTFIMLTLTWGLMLGYLVLGVRRNRDRTCNVSMCGFFYQGFRHGRWYWDVVVMLRKLILAGLMVASYDDEHGSEENIAGVSTVVLFAISLVAQAYAMPYRDSAADLNHLEMASLASTLIVFLSGVIFNHEELSQIGRIAFSVLAISSMVVTLLAILCKLVRAGFAGRKGAGRGTCSRSWLARLG